jgi:hypothetical protein
LKSVWYLPKLACNSWKDHWTWSRFIITLSSNKQRNISQLHGCVALYMNEYMGTLSLNNLLLPPPPPLACPSLASSSSLPEPVRPGAMSPDRALCLPTFSHFLIVNKTSLPLSLQYIHLHTHTHTHTHCVFIQHMSYVAP